MKIKAVSHEILKLLTFDNNEKEKPLLKFREDCRFSRDQKRKRCE